MGDTATLIRLVVASTLVGLMAYCLAYVVQVWRKRNARPGPVTSTARRLALGCFLVGAVLLPASAVHRELTRGEGVLTGEGLFTVRAGDDQDVEWLQGGDPVAAGESLARFGSGTRSARADELQARLARAEADRDVLALLPLAPDPELTRRQQAVSQERGQAQQELGQAVIAAEAAGRDLTAQLFAKKEALAKLELTLTERRKELDRATLRGHHAALQLAKVEKLWAGGSVSATEYQDLLKASRDAGIELASLTQEAQDLLAQKGEFRSQLDKLEAGRSDPAGPLRRQVAGSTARLARLEAEEGELKAKIDRDLARSAKLREAEKAQTAAKVREQQAGVDAAAREREVRAPFAGKLAYRAASPQAVRPRGTLAVLAPDDGFRLTARMSQSDADALSEGAGVAIELGEDSPERRIPARFRKTESLAHEPGYAALQLECLPPPEMVRRLAEGEKLTVAFAWHPPLVAMWHFRAGVLLFATGLAGLLLTGLRGDGGTGSEAVWSGRVVTLALSSVRAGRMVEVRTLRGPNDSGEWFGGAETRRGAVLAMPERFPNPLRVVKLLVRFRKPRRSQKAASGCERFQHLRQVLGAPKTSLPQAGGALSVQTVVSLRP